ncbi:hypothetical protein MNBD_GAMMA10-3140 [hydrothermal vent metagenome]|uniref:Baseplate protein J-like domain-containing protein n=1 Tax=hydrothermal vent metagenome TaxID=652676 RepID=A0A3B0YCG0_9ZZZZ
MACQHDCDKAKIYPEKIQNRPALDNINYRIGSYATMREHLLDTLNQNKTLQHWTHRGADDPGIALLEGAAIVGDVLSFYQNLYANEVFLRTANWQESIRERVQLTGYRPAPGIGGETHFAVRVKGEQPVLIPAGFGFKATLKDQPQSAEFESTTEVIACPHLSEFNLYRRPQPAASIAPNTNQLELVAVGNQSNITDITNIDIRAGDRIMLLPDGSMFNTNSIYAAQKKSEILIVKSVETLLDRLRITFEGQLMHSRAQQVSAYVIGRSFRHFGYNAPRKLNKYNGTQVTQVDTKFTRWVAGKTSGSTYYSGFSAIEMPLDQTLNDIALGSKLICEGFFEFKDHTGVSVISRNNVPFTLLKKITDFSTDTLQWAHIEGSTTVLTLNSRLIKNAQIRQEKIDIRSIRFHEVISPKLTLASPTQWQDNEFSNGIVQYFGSYEQLRALAERRLIFRDNTSGATQTVHVSSSENDFELALSASGKDKKNPWLWDITLQETPQFQQRQFDQQTPEVTVYGNTVASTQGKTIADVVLGSGDNREIFQTFKIPDAPLTWLLNPAQTPAHQAALKIYVEGILWQPVDNFFNSRAEDSVYIIREDEQGDSWVQFGDGKNGARLPSGNNNILATYRKGNGATGVIEVDSNASAVGKLKALEKVFLPGEVLGGALAESAETTRIAAPVKMQSLGRIVSLADIEAETLNIPGVLKARADWAAPNGVPLVQLTVLTKSASQAALDKVRDTLMYYSRCRGPARFSILVLKGNLAFIYLNVRAGYAANRRVEDIRPQIMQALGTISLNPESSNTQGLFGSQTTRFGQPTHISKIIAAIQQVDGIRWVEIDALQKMNPGTAQETDPLNFIKPSVLSRNDVINCPPTCLLALHEQHIDLSLGLDAIKRECE